MSHIDGDAHQENTGDKHDHAVFRQREPLCDPLGAFGAAPTTGRQAGESKYAEHALQKIYAVMLVVISELE